MPRKFTPDEEKRILQALYEAGRKVMGRKGIRKTTIDELATAAGISKGSFYRFFKSKEALALELLARWERGFHAGIEERFRKDAPRGVGQTAQVLAVILLNDFPGQIVESGLEALMEPEEIHHLIQRAAPEQVTMMDEQDLRLLQNLKPLLHTAGLVQTENDGVMVAGLRMVFDAGIGLLRLPPSQTLSPENRQVAFQRLLQGFIAQTFQPVPTGDRYEQGSVELPNGNCHHES